MLIVEQNAELALELADQAYLLETGAHRDVRHRRRNPRGRERCAKPISAIEETRPMELLTQQVLSGIATGGIYACMALAVVMIYQAIHHLNFAQGEMAMFSTFIAWQLLHGACRIGCAFVAHDRASPSPAAC